MSAHILALSTAVPAHCYSQKEVAEKVISIFQMDNDKGEAAKRIYLNSAIEKRYSVIPDFLYERDRWEFWGPQYPRQVPGMTQRNNIYKDEAPKLAEEAACKVIKKWGGDPSEITHIISVSCTGMMAPGIEFHLMQKLGLSPAVNRLGINFMGCFGAFKGLAVAKAFASENKKNRILLICTELCSLHLQAKPDLETITGHSLFADGAAGAIIGAQPDQKENSLWEIIKTQSVGFQKSLDKMSWEAGDQGFIMRLSPEVPVLIKRQIKQFSEDLIGKEIPIKEADWAIHPGGKSILQAVEKALNLSLEQSQSSWDILKEYGNMSSATFLFVLDRLSLKDKLHPWTIGLGFGPGLSAEGILLK